MLGTLVLLSPILTPIAQTAMAGILGWVSIQLSKHLGMAQEGKANQTIQTAIKNFAGDLLARIQNGDMTVADLTNGKAVGKLAGYLAATVGDSLNTVGPIATNTLQTMLNGKIAELGVTTMPIPVDMSSTATAGVLGAPTAQQLGIR